MVVPVVAAGAAAAAAGGGAAAGGAAAGGAAAGGAAATGAAAGGAATGATASGAAASSASTGSLASAGVSNAARAGTLSRGQHAAKISQGPQGAQGRFGVDAGPGAKPPASQVQPRAQGSQFNTQDFKRQIDQAERFVEQVSPEDQRRQEAEHKAKMARDRKRIKSQVSSFKLPSLQGLSPSQQLQLQPDIAKFNQFFGRAAQIQPQNIAGQMQSQIVSKMKAQAADQLKKKIKKLVVDKLLKEKGRRYVWRIFGRGGELEDEGALLWFWASTSKVATGLQAVKTIMKPKGGDFLGEPIAWLEPPNLGFADSAKMSNMDEMVQIWIIDLLDIAVYFFILVIIFVAIHLLMAIIGGIAYTIYLLSQLEGGVITGGWAPFSEIFNFIF